MFSECVEFDDSDMADVDYKTRHSQRCKQLGLKDPVYSTSLKDYVHAQLMGMRSQLDGDRYQSLMLTVASEDLDNLRDYFDLGFQIQMPQIGA